MNHKMNNVQNANIPKSLYEALIDHGLTFGATDYLVSRKPKEPWAKDCLRKFIDVIINHKRIYYPIQTRHALEEDSPHLLADILSEAKKLRIVSPFDKAVAIEQKLTIAEMQKVYKDFCLFARKDRKKMVEWLMFHETPEIMGKHIDRWGTEAIIHKESINFWEKNKKCRDLADELQIPENLLMLGFDVFQRGVLYYNMVCDNDVCYFFHPARKNLFEDLFTESSVLSDCWSWGNYIVNLIDAKQISNDISEIIDIVKRIRNKTIIEKATMYSLQKQDMKESGRKREKLITIASEIGLPAKITDKTIKVVQILLGGVGAFVDSTIGTICFATLALSLAGFNFGEKERYVPGYLGKKKILRGALEWPGLI